MVTLNTHLLLYVIIQSADHVVAAQFINFIIKMSNLCILCDFDVVMVSDRLVLSISETAALLGFLHVTVSSL